MKKFGWLVILLFLAGCGNAEPADTYVMLDGVISRAHTGENTGVFVRDLSSLDTDLQGETELHAISKIENEKDGRALNVASLDVEDRVQVYLKADFKTKEKAVREIAYKDIIKIVKE
ncbi:hypothetical protein [Listeria sp. ILCC797]|uniref:hypothetical protein n=1 Tax=Listeria sp. ILCC797 TaxID=1918333 RepID=UPI000B58A2AE|nr:hypothetical protein [Listeria sp. ILCC797]